MFGVAVPGDGTGARDGESGFTGATVTAALGRTNTCTLSAATPDVAETMVLLVEKGDALPAFATYQMEGHWDPDGTRIAAAIARAAGKPELKAGAFPWWLLLLGSPFVPVFRELREMRYLWRQPVRMSNALLCSVLGGEPHTPLDTAMRATLIGLGCLEDAEQDGPDRRQAAASR